MASIATSLQLISSAVNELIQEQKIQTAMISALHRNSAFPAAKDIILFIEQNQLNVPFENYESFLES